MEAAKKAKIDEELRRQEEEAAEQIRQVKRQADKDRLNTSLTREYIMDQIKIRETNNDAYVKLELNALNDIYKYRNTQYKNIKYIRDLEEYLSDYVHTNYPMT